MGELTALQALGIFCLVYLCVILWYVWTLYQDMTPKRRSYYEEN